MKLEAEVAPLEGKYYGTQVVVKDSEGNEQWIMVWCNAFNFDPSEREYDLEYEGKFYTIDQDSLHLEDGELSVGMWEYEISDNHYESRSSYKIAKAIAEAINGLEV